MTDQTNIPPSQVWLQAARLARLKPQEALVRLLADRWAWLEAQLPQGPAADSPPQEADDFGCLTTRSQLRPDQAVQQAPPDLTTVPMDNGWFLLSRLDWLEEALP